MTRARITLQGRDHTTPRSTARDGSRPLHVPMHDETREWPFRLVGVAFWAVVFAALTRLLV